eukprot:15482260-Alexandrium_andersonii.AAC.1
MRGVPPCVLSSCLLAACARGDLRASAAFARAVRAGRRTSARASPSLSSSPPPPQSPATQSSLTLLSAIAAAVVASLPEAVLGQPEMAGRSTAFSGTAPKWADAIAPRFHPGPPTKQDGERASRSSIVANRAVWQSTRALRRNVSTSKILMLKALEL